MDEEDIDLYGDLSTDLGLDLGDQGLDTDDKEEPLEARDVKATDSDVVNTPDNAAQPADSTEVTALESTEGDKGVDTMDKTLSEPSIGDPVPSFDAGNAGNNESHRNQQQPLRQSQWKPNMKPSVYIGNMNWWTTDQNLLDLCKDLGVTDVQRIKFHEDRLNGKSLGYGVIDLESDMSCRTLLEKLPDTNIPGSDKKFKVVHCAEMPIQQFAHVIGAPQESSAAGGPSRPPRSRNVSHRGGRGGFRGRFPPPHQRSDMIWGAQQQQRGMGWRGPRLPPPGYMGYDAWRGSAPPDYYGRHMDMPRVDSYDDRMDGVQESAGTSTTEKSKSDKFESRKEDKPVEDYGSPRYEERKTRHPEEEKSSSRHREHKEQRDSKGRDRDRERRRDRHTDSRSSRSSDSRRRHDDERDDDRKRSRSSHKSSSSSSRRR